MKEFTVNRPLPPKQLHPNGGGKWPWGMIARLKKKTRTSARLATLEVIGLHPFHGEVKYDVHLQCYMRSARQTSHMDENNVGHWAKADIDGIADAMGVNDKNFKSPTIEIFADPDCHESRRLVITIRRVV